MRFSRYKFFTAIRRKDIPFIEHYLEEGVDINMTEKQKDGLTPIEEAAFRNDSQICLLLLTYNPDLSLTNCLLYWPAYHSNYDLFKLLVESNAPIAGIIDKCLFEACTKDEFNIVRDSIKLGANPNFRQNDLTPLHRVARYGSLNIAKLLVEKGANIEAIDHCSRTPFHYAALYNNFEVLEYLFLEGANSDGVIKGNFAYVGSEEMRKFYNVLIQKDQIKLNKFKEWLQNRLRFLKGGPIEDELKKYILNSDLISTKKLISNNKEELNINVGYNYDYMEDVTPLHLAITTNNIEMVKYLLQNGADINCTSNRGLNVYSFIDFETHTKESTEIFTLLKNHENQARAAEITRKYGSEALCYKKVFLPACQQCINLFLTNGIGSAPRVFKLSELIKNGTNECRKVADWLPTLGSVHSQCKCEVFPVFKGQKWNESTGSFEYSGERERKVIRTSKIKVTVGDKVFFV